MLRLCMSVIDDLLGLLGNYSEEFERASKTFVLNDDYGRINFDRTNRDLMDSMSDGDKEQFYEKGLPNYQAFADSLARKFEEKFGDPIYLRFEDCGGCYDAGLFFSRKA